MDGNIFRMVPNQLFRDSWIREQLSKIAETQSVGSLNLLDVGAGLSPYRKFITDLGLLYYSQDFSQYVPNSELLGFQEVSWDYPKHDYVCDILDIPIDKKFNIVLCTEVLEHVPDPIRAFQVLTKLLNPGGTLIVTVPIMSLAHQAPYWFHSGMSQYWFEYWSNKFGIDDFQVYLHGDFVDLEIQNMKSFFDFKRPWRVPGLPKIIASTLKVLSRFVKDEVRSSGGFGTLYVGRKSS